MACCRLMSRANFACSSCCCIGLVVRDDGLRRLLAYPVLGLRPAAEEVSKPSKDVTHVLENSLREIDMAWVMTADERRQKDDRVSGRGGCRVARGYLCRKRSEVRGY